MKLLILLLLLSGPCLVFSQDSSDISFSVGAGGGIGFYNLNYDFTAGPRNIPLHPRYSMLVSITYGMIKLVDKAGLDLTLQASYSTSATGSVKYFLYNGSSETTWEFGELMLWPRFYVNNKFSPFIEAGVGVGFVRAKEQYEGPRLDKASGSSTGLKLGVGGGISYLFSNSVTFDAYTQTIYLFKDVTFTGNFNSWTSLKPVIITVGLKINHRF